jgi:hypothetical protein
MATEELPGMVERERERGPVPGGMVRLQMPDGSIVDKPERCSVDGPTIKECWKLEMLLDKEQQRQGARVRIGPMMARDHDRQRDGLVLDLGAKSLWFVNFCPFCGVAITTTFPPPPAAEGTVS